MERRGSPKKMTSEVSKKSLSEFEVIVPTHLNPKRGSKGKKIPLNLNWYRNAMYYLQNTAKQAFKQMLKDELESVEFKGKVSIKYTLYVGTKKKSDLNNWISIVDKFFQDSLVYYKCIEDDNYDVIPYTSSSYGGYDKGNARVSIKVETIKEEAING